MTSCPNAAKLAQLVEIAGYDSVEELLKAVFSYAVSPSTGAGELRRWRYGRPTRGPPKISHCH
jgi:hypothetical protein